QGAQSETGSIIEPVTAQVARSLDAKVSVERIVYVNHDRREGGSSNVVIRGIGEFGRELRPSVKLVEGRWFTPGLHELTVSRAIAERFANCSLGDTLKTGRGAWKVVGIFDAGQTAYASEMWTSAEDVLSMFHRIYFSAVLAQSNDVDRLIQQLESDPRLHLDAQCERDFFADQTKAATPIFLLGNIIAVIMAVGSAFAAMNTMYAAVGSRVREVAVLRALGFSAIAIATSFLIEATLLASLGGLLGGLFTLPLNGIATGTTNWFSFSEMSFQFTITPKLIIEGIVFAAVMGLAGGVLPALRASRLSPASAMRAL
ncbi:MAG TPA: ABC transporter permease, partial [Thermoanaerobaculia bacterium]|nr:ABC transporter permease [Thermoanaerobaculia bacterium]